MENTLTVAVAIKNKDGEIIAASESEREMPYVCEIEKQGFRSAFHDMETAVLEARKEASEQALSSYLGAASLKKPYPSQ